MTAAAIQILTSRFIAQCARCCYAASMGRDQAVWDFLLPDQSIQVTDIHPMTSQSSLRLSILAGIGKADLWRCEAGTYHSR